LTELTTSTRDRKLKRSRQLRLTDRGIQSTKKKSYTIIYT